ncbi:MAG: hypothetical protein WAT79_17200 [Saprospiraceae bacterium]
MRLIKTALMVGLIIYGNACSKSAFPIDNDMEEMVLDSMPFLPRISLGTISNKDLNEVSGMVSSRIMPGHFWVHNDSGDNSSLYLINEKAEHLNTITIAGITNRDWEDIAIFNEVASQKSLLLIGDFGDNLAQYHFGTIYIIAEPILLQGQDSIIPLISKIVFKFADGPRDCETLMVDPITGDIYLVSKREPQVALYKIDYPFNTSDTVVAEKLMVLPFTQMVAGDISADGKDIIIKSYDEIFYFRRKIVESLVEALSKNPIKVPYIREPQGEAIAWSMDGKSMYTLSEATFLNITPVLYRYDKK